MRKSMQASVTWSLVKVTGFWCVFAQSALLLTYMLGISPVRFFYIAAAGFGLQSIFVLLEGLFADGFSWKLFFSAAVCFALGMGIFSPLPLLKVDYAAGPAWLFRGVAGWREDGKTNAQSLQAEPVNQLAAAARLIFENETQESLVEGRRRLLSIPQPAAEYKSAQALLRVAESRLNEPRFQKDVGAKKKAPIESITSEQTEHGLRVTLQNNGNKSVGNIRYRVSYFRAVDGWHLEPDKESVIIKEIPPHQTRTFELSDKNIVKGLIYGSFAVVNWKVGPMS